MLRRFVSAVMWAALGCGVCCARSSIMRREARRRFCSSSGSPHPHLSHLRSMCCSHILCQTTSSSARSRQLWDTCAARQRDAVSRYERILNEISGGRVDRKSMRIRSRTAAERYDSCGKQHCCRMPWSMSFRIGAGAAEKSVHTWLMACWSAWGSFSMPCAKTTSSCQQKNCPHGSTQAATLAFCSSSMVGSFAWRRHLRSGRWR